jgi:hypothetical protein
MFLGAFGLFLAFIVGMIVAPFSGYFTALSFPACTVVKFVNDTRYGISPLEAYPVMDAERSKNDALNVLKQWESRLDESRRGLELSYRREVKKCNMLTDLSDEDYHNAIKSQLERGNLGQGNVGKMFEAQKLAKHCRANPIQLETPYYLAQVAKQKEVNSEISELLVSNPNARAAFYRLEALKEEPKVCKELQE